MTLTYLRDLEGWRNLVNGMHHTQKLLECSEDRQQEEIHLAAMTWRFIYRHALDVKPAELWPLMRDDAVMRLHRAHIPNLYGAN